MQVFKDGGGGRALSAKKAWFWSSLGGELERVDGTQRWRTGNANGFF